MGDVINLKRARKRRDKEADAKTAESNRVKFGRTKAERARDAKEGEKADRVLDQHQLSKGDAI